MQHNLVVLVATDAGAGAAGFASHSSPANAEAARRRLGWLGRNHGFQYYAIVALGRRGGEQPVIVDTDLPQSALADLATCGPLGACSVFARLRLSTLPFGWDSGRDCLDGFDVPTALSYDDSVHDAALKGNGILGGYCVPVHAVDGRRGVVFFLGGRPEAGSHYTALTTAALELFADIIAAEPDLLTIGPSLANERDRQLLLMLRDGLPMADIAAALGLSDIGLRKVLANLIERLQATSLVQAVALAFDGRMID